MYFSNSSAIFNDINGLLKMPSSSAKLLIFCTPPVSGITNTRYLTAISTNLLTAVSSCFATPSADDMIFNPELGMKVTQDRLGNKQYTFKFGTFTTTGVINK